MRFGARPTKGRGLWLTMVLCLLAGLLPQEAWADNSGLEQAFVGDKQYYVLRSADDWDKFRQLVADANGKSEVNAIMDADFSISNPVGLDVAPYRGTFNGNGHTLNVNIDWGSNYYAAPFPSVNQATFKNLTVTGSVNGAEHCAGLIGHSYGSSPSFTIEKVRVSTNVTVTDSHIGGFIGHAGDAEINMTDCLADGSLTAKGSDAYSGTFVGWASSGGKWYFHRVYESVTFTGVAHQSVCYYYDGGAKYWGYNSSSTLIVASHNWGEMASGCKSVTNQSTVAKKMNGEKAGTWQVVDGRAVPVMQTWPSATDVNFETYDIIPGTEDDEKGMLKIPFSCDQAVKTLDVTYANEDGLTRKIHMECKANTYAGFILVPATEQHKGLTIKAKLLVGTVTKTVDDKNDAVLHNPRQFSAQLLDYKSTKKLEDAGAVELKWEVDAPKYTDAIASDQFNVMRSLTGKEDDMESIGTVPFEEGTASYTFRDETLMSALTAEQLNASTAVPQVQYRVVRASAQQLWGFSNTTASAQTVSSLPMLHLLRVKDYQTEWADQTARTVKVKWEYADEPGAVWDPRAKMNIVVSSTNREGAAVDATTYTLTADEMAACEKVIQLSRSCVDYSIVFGVELSESVLPLEAPYFEIRTAKDWTTFCQKVKDAGASYNVNASLMADITVSEIAAYNSAQAYRGTFEGNGHTLNLNISDNAMNTALFSHVATATFRNLNLTGTVSSSQIHLGSLIGFLETGATVTIENCRSSVKLVSSRNGDAYMGGFVGHSGTGSMQLFINNCKFEGSFEGPNAQRNGGFVGWTSSSSGKVNITNCLFAPAAINTKFTYCDTWVWTNNPEKVTITNSYAIREYNSNSTQYANYLVINNAGDWETFRTKVEEAGGNSDVNAVLNADITVSSSVGYNNSYRGKFDGNGHMLTLNFNTSEQYTAPFRYVAGATIYTLRVAGTATSSAKFVAGIVGACSGGTNEIICCRVSATIDSSIDGDATNGGLVSVVGTNATLEITDCLFDGKFTGDKCYANGGFVGWNDGKTTIKNSLFNGTSTTKTSGCRTFARSRDYNKLTLTNNYYTNAMDDGDTKQGTSTAGIANSLLADKLEKYVWRIWDGIVVPVSSPLVTIGNMAGKTADQIVALLGSGWEKNAKGQVTPKMADNKQVEIPYSAKHPYMINTAADWDTFRNMVEDAKGQYDVYAQLMADISITEPAGVSTGHFRGTFNGNGHTLAVNIDKANWNSAAPFQYVTGNSTISNLHVTGKITGQRYAAGIVGEVDNDATVKVMNCHSSVYLDVYRYGGGIVGNFNASTLTVSNCLFDGTIHNRSYVLWNGDPACFAGAFVGWGSSQTLVVENCLDNGKFEGFVYGSSTLYSANCNGGWTAWGGTNNWTNDDIVAKVCNKIGTKTAAELVMLLGSQMWQVSPTGKPIPKNVGVLIDGMSTFYYENMGHIDKQSLMVTTKPTSVVLTWANEGDEPVDYYEVYRMDKEEGGFERIVTQLTDMQYEDKGTSPVKQYIYKVRGVNSCEGLHFDETKEVEGMCEQTCTVEGYLRFLDGTGIPGQKISVNVDNVEVPTTTDESGFFRLKGLPYKDKKQTDYELATTIDGVGGQVTFGTGAGENVVKNVVIEVGTSVKISGYVQYDGTSIPVQGVSFKVNNHEVRNAAGLVTTDHEGKFAFRILPGDVTIKAVKDGHEFWRKGYYHEKDTDADQDTTYNIRVDKAGLMFYDQTRVKMIGRIVGGKTQGELPLGYALSKNNLGNKLQMVLSLEGDNTSRLVFDIQNRDLKERTEVFEHKTANEKDKKYKHQTEVHTTLNRMVVKPDIHTGEYEVLLPPVKWKIQQITADGYATLFQDGQVGDVIDLSDSLKEHQDVVKGTWETATYKVTDPVEKYYAKYNRIYHSPVLIEYKQQGFDNFDYFGEHYYSYQNLNGDKEKLALAYGVKKKGWPEGKRDSLETRYTFGHPVFNIDRKYGFTISALERYYYNNNTKSDTIDVVHLSGGVVTIHNGMVSATHRDTLHLDSLGQANYTIEAAQTPYLLTGDDALHTVTMTLEMDGTHYEAEPLKAYVLNVKPKDGAKDILSFSKPLLVDILRDPPGATSKATLSKGSTLKYTYTMDLKYSAGVSIGMGIGTGVNSFTGVVASPMGVGAVGGFQNGSTNYYGTSLDLVVSGSGQRAFSYTMTAKEDISTSSDKKLIGADGDLYMGVVQNVTLKPATAIRAIPHSAFQQMAGAVMKGRMVEIAQGKDDRDSLLHFVRDEVVTYEPAITSDFVHSQHYIVNQLLPELTEQVYSMMFIGTEAEAKAKANADKEPVYLSLVGKDDPDFGTKYTMIAPDGADAGTIDRVKEHLNAIEGWMLMIAQNEKEKLAAKNLVKNFDVDGGSSVSYSETFASDYTVANSLVSPIQMADYFDIGRAGSDAVGFAVIVGNTAAKLLTSLLKQSKGKTTGETALNGDKDGIHVDVEAVGVTFKFSLTPVFSLDVTPKNTESKSYSRTESFTIGMDKKSHLDFDVYKVETSVDKLGGDDLSAFDVFFNKNFTDLVDYNKEHMNSDSQAKKLVDKFIYPRSFVYRTRGGATCRPWEDERTTMFYEPGKVIDERTKKIENPKITMDKQSISGVPYGEPARFKLYLTNESEQPEAVYNYFDLYLVEKSNPKGAKLMIDGMPLTGNSRTIEVRPGQVTEKTLEVYAGEDFDYEGLKIGLISQGDLNCYSQVAFDVHYLQTAGAIAITSPGDKWIMNCDAPTEGNKGWYLPVVISGFDKNQHNFDHIEFQYKETTRGDDYWTNLCGYYADSTIYRAATGTKEMIPDNGNIMARFFGEGTVMEKAYDLRAVLFCRNGNGFLTNESKVLSGVKDTRRPQLFGSPDPKSGIVGAGDNIVFNFSEDIEYNYLQATTNFEVVGETNETAIQEAPSLQFGGNGYAQMKARRNFGDKSVTVEVMIKPDDTGKDMPLFSHGSEGKRLELWLTKEKKLRAVVGERVMETDSVVKAKGFQRVALVLDNENKQLMIYGQDQMGRWDDVTYSGTGPLTFGGARLDNAQEVKFYEGRMLQGRLWYRAMDQAGLSRYGGRLLTGYEMGLVDYYPMNDGTGEYAQDLAQGAHLTLNGASWAQPNGMSLKIDNDTTGIGSNSNIFEIKTDADWETFCKLVEDAKGERDVDAKLMADINITEPVGGKYSNGWRGNFDGGGHTLTANILQYTAEDECMSPFRYVTGNSAIRNLTVAGHIKGRAMTAGIAGGIDDSANLTISGCRVTAFIEGFKYAGGIVGHARKSQLTVKNCLFDGRINNWAEYYDTYGAAFVAWGDPGANVTVQNCMENAHWDNNRWHHTAPNWQYNGQKKNIGSYFIGDNIWSNRPWGYTNSISGKSAEELADALGSGWQVDASGKAVPRIIDLERFNASKPKGLQLRTDLFQRNDEEDYTLMFWFKTAKENGTLMANGSGKADDEGARNKFFIGFENHTLKYRTNGREFALGNDLCNDAWHHFAITVNRSRNVASIYVDNVVKAQLTTDSLGGMLGTRFFLGDMVWQEKGDPDYYEANAYTGYIDGLALFEQALPTTLIKRYTTKSPGGSERGLKVYTSFDCQEEQRTGELALMPYALSKVVKYDNDGNPTGQTDSIFVAPVDKVLSMIDQNVGAPVQAYEELRKLNFSYVGRDNQLLVNIDEPDARINKKNIYVTVRDIPDKNGNFMASPATETFFVNRNPLTWMALAKRRNVTIPAGTGWTIIGTILNNGGKAHTYTLENLPRWISPSKTSDIVLPQGEDEVTFTISKDLEVGTFDQIIYLTDEDGMSDALYLEITVEGDAPDWKVNPVLQRYSMNVVAQVFVNNNLVTDARDKVAAFDAEGRCMGVNNIEYDTATGQSMLYMTVYDSTTVATPLEFRLWHYATGKTMQLTPSQDIKFGNKAIIGTVDNPVKLSADDQYQQTIDLAQGWNWISFNVYNKDFTSLSAVLNKFPWQEGDILADETEGLTLVYKKGQWISTTGSNIENLELSQAVSYSILVQNSQQIDIWGSAFKEEQQRTITVKPGWSNIGYTPLVNLPVTTALSDYFDEATPGDVVKNQHEFAMFTADGKGGGKWQGTLKYMKPGEGYMIHRQKADTATFCYPYYEPGDTYIETTIAHAARFATTMNIVAEAVGVEVEEGDRLVAYANGEAVGESLMMSAAKPLTTGPLFYLSIEGELETPLTFAIERGDDIIATTGEVMKYKVNGISGSPDEPTKISFVKTDQLPQDGWYSVQGIKLQKAPTQSGVYIYNGKKQVIK